MRGRVKRTAAMIVVTAALVLAGCWHKKTQQQKFLEALNRGNGAQAAEIWRNMDADSRAALAHNEGIKPTLSAAQIKQQVMQHYGAGPESDSDDETIEQVTPNVGSGGLESLPGYIGGPNGGAPTAIAPSTTQPAN